MILNKLIGNDINWADRERSERTHDSRKYFIDHVAA
jgi:hypothetical protein